MCRYEVASLGRAQAEPPSGGGAVQAFEEVIQIGRHLAGPTGPLRRSVGSFVIGRHQFYPDRSGTARSGPRPPCAAPSALAGLACISLPG